jgi:hypothetical protein
VDRPRMTALTIPSRWFSTVDANWMVLFYELFRSCFFEINRAVSGVFCPALEGEKKSLPGVNPAGKKKREGDPQGIRSADFGRSSGICA